MLINQSEDLMLIGHSDGRLILQRKDRLQWKKIQQMKISSFIINLSLNQQENNIIAQVGQTQIVIIKKTTKNEDSCWIVVQEIEIYSSFRTIIFIEENTFAIKLFNINKWMLFNQKKNGQFNHKRDIFIFGTNNDLYYILEKYHKGILRIPDESNCFLNIEYQIEQPYLAVRDTKESDNSFCNHVYKDLKIAEEFFLGEDFTKQQLIIGKQEQLIIEYLLIGQIPCEHQENYQTMALKNDLKTLAVGCNNQIKVFRLEEQQLSLLQVLNNHSGNVLCLIFSQQVDSFISGSQDKSLKIWTWDERDKLYQCQQILYGSVEQKYIIMNRQENLLVSGGQNIISFWAFQRSHWSLTQSLYFDSNSIYTLNFNPSQQIICTYSSNNKILLIRQTRVKGKICWFVSLQLDVNNFTPSLCFISDYILLFQSIKDMAIRLIKLSHDCNEIQYQSEIFINQVCDEQTTFSMQYNQNKSVLINQTRSVLNLFLIFNGNQIQHHQKHSFENVNIKGLLSTDGELLITFDQESSKFEVRKYTSSC